MTAKVPRVLFLLKNESNYSSYSYGTYKSSGLFNSAKFVSDMLNAAGVVSQISVVQDNNDIDREVFNFKPTHAIIEALWVVPSKFAVLKKLHPNVIWIVRIHSELPFLAMEGIAMDWIKKYVQQPNVFVASNDLRGQEDLEKVTGTDILYLPNYYPLGFAAPKKTSLRGAVKIGCFGAIRPFKNQLLQAVAAMDYANKNRLILTFYLNSTRVEQQGETALKNIQALFAGTRHTLASVPWMEHADFLKFVIGMDLVLSVSFTETFSIVTADAVSQGVPIVTSPEVTWASPKIQADPNSTDDVELKISKALSNGIFKPITASNQKRLTAFSNEARSLWLDYLDA